MANFNCVIDGDFIMRIFQPQTSVVTLLLWAFIISANGQATEGFTFDHLTVEEGLSQSSVFAITKDAEGFMWFGTRDGLNRYDSRSIKVYRKKENNARSLSGNSINCLIIDRQKKLWIGTNEGLNIYDAETDDFIRGELDTDFEPPIANDVTAIHEDKKGTIWIGTATGLAIVVSRNPLRYKYYRHPAADLDKLLEDEIRTLYTDQEGSLWIGTTKGVCRLTEDVSGNFTFNSYPLYSTNLQGKSWINSLAEDRAGNILIGTEQNGIKVLNKRSGRISSFNFINSEGRSIETVRAIQRNDDDLWIGTLGGLYIFNLTTARLHFYKNNPDDNLSLSDNSVRSIYSDQSGTHWIGTFYGGVNSYSPLSRQFGKIDLTDLKNQKVYKIGGPMVTDGQGNLWISTDG
ncbi:MAG: hypothetical protein C0490_01140, partial [Marivirga sp.]|nr:hypothetical protein [Marivirga sp.]